MAETHFFLYHLPLSFQISAMETFGQGFSSFTSPPLLLFHANSSNLVPNVFGSSFLGLDLYFWVWVSISWFESLFVFGFVCQTSRERLKKTHELCHHRRQRHHWWPSISLFLCSNFFFFFSFLVWFFVGLGLGQFANWVFLCDIRIWRFFIWV